MLGVPHICHSRPQHVARNTADPSIKKFREMSTDRIFNDFYTGKNDKIP
jgi:hypothetical protein